MAVAGAITAPPLILWPPHRLVQLALDSAVQSAKWRNVVNESTGTVTFITTHARLVSFAKKHSSVAAYEADAVGEAVQRLLEQGAGCLRELKVLPEVRLSVSLCELGIIAAVDCAGRMPTGQNWENR